ncbi:MAG: hypothetical protein ACOX28_00875 [Bacilli bacterium]|jgi:hypothetical protein
MIRKLNTEELALVKGGEPITMAAIMAILTIALVMSIVYKLYGSNQGKAKLPGGFNFEWK